MRFQGIVALLAAGVLLSTHLGHAEDRSDLWIVSGQSNACGRGPLPGPTGDDRVRMFDESTGQFVVAEDPLPGMNTDGVGPWVAAAQRVAAAPAVGTHGRGIDLVGFAKGAQPISFWDPGASGDLHLMGRIARVGQGAGVFLWYQGESDAATAESVAAYQEKLATLVERVRAASGNPRLTAVIVQLGPNTRTRPKDFAADYMGLREAQRRFVVADGNALLVPALGRPLKDGVHLATPGYVELGDEIGGALLRSRFGRSDLSWPGPVLDAAVLHGSDRQVTAHFAEVQRLGGVTVGDFVVVDEGGPAACREASSSNTTVQLTFSRKITLPAHLVYAYGNGPEGTLIDEAGHRAPAVQVELTRGPPPDDGPTAAPNGAGSQ